MKLGTEPKLQVKVVSPTMTHYDGTALSVSAVNQVGPFDILAGHANFFSLLSSGNITINTGVEQLQIPVNQGLIKVKNNIITLFIDIEPGLQKD